MQPELTLSLRRVAWLEFAADISKWLTRLALLACLGLILYVVGYFIYEMIYPPAVVINPAAGPLFGYDDGRRAIRLVTPALRWIGRILFLPSSVQVIVAAYLLWHNQKATKKLIGGAIMMLLSSLLALSVSMSCGC